MHVNIIAVRVEAEKIRIGQKFSKFKDFDGCVDLWSILQGRSNAMVRFSLKRTSRAYFLFSGAFKLN